MHGASHTVPVGGCLVLENQLLPEHTHLCMKFRSRAENCQVKSQRVRPHLNAMHEYSSRNVSKPLDSKNWQHSLRRLCGLEVRVPDPEVQVRLPELPDFLRSRATGTGSTQPLEYN
jgi:hypothetical protein